MVDFIRNYVDGAWHDPQASDRSPVTNPATAELLGEAPLSDRNAVDQAAAAAAAAFPEWRRTPAVERVQYLFKLKQLMEDSFDELARTITTENGKTLRESSGELRRAIENVEVACGIPTLMQGYNSEDIARGIDEIMIRQPVGVVSIICPFNFPAMIPFWFLPYAVACGNTCLVKPSERVPLTMIKVFHLIEQVGFPPGVVNLVHGARDTVEAMLEHPTIRAVSFVGSTPVARRVYAEASAHGKRVQVQGGAKNPIIVLPDADLEQATEIVADSAFGNAGQRCLAASLAVTVGEAGEPFAAAITQAAADRVVGSGLDEGVQMGPVISEQSRERIHGMIERGQTEGAELVIDGRNPRISGYESGYFVRPTVLKGVPRNGEVFRTEIFGPVLGLMQVDTIDQAIELVNSGDYGNMACLLTQSGAAGRRFRYEAEVGNLGINVGVAAPMAFFPFSGWRDSFFGVLHAQGRDAVEFYTQQKVVVERWN